MARISGVNLPAKKQIHIALTQVHGIGRPSSEDILKEAKVDPTIRVEKLSNDQVHTIQEIINATYTVEGDMRKEKMLSIKRLKDIDSWRGSRHKKKLPVRGQTTRINSRTVRGNKKSTVGSGRKGAPAPK
jgi:small subunit ribosomal protein S13